MSKTIAEITATPNSRKFSLSAKGGKVRITLRSPPENNKANLELVSELSKLLGCPVRLISGHGSRRKKLELGISEEEWLAFLNAAEP